MTGNQIPDTFDIHQLINLHIYPRYKYLEITVFQGKSSKIFDRLGFSHRPPSWTGTPWALETRLFFSRQFFQSLGSLVVFKFQDGRQQQLVLFEYYIWPKGIGLWSCCKRIMDKFVVRTKRLPRPERQTTVTKDNKKQTTIESLAVSILRLEFRRIAGNQKLMGFCGNSMLNKLKSLNLSCAVILVAY